MTDTRAERRMEWVTKNQQQFPDNKPADWLAAVKQGICPFCGAGPFIVVASHVQRMHGYDRREFRDMLGVYYGDSICDPDHSKLRAEHSRRMYKEGRTRIGTTQGAPRNLSMAAKRRNAEQAKRTMTPEMRKRIGKTNSANRLAKAAPLHNQVLELIDTTEMTYQQIAVQVGIHPRTVHLIAVRNGVDADGRARYAAARRGQDSPHLLQARQQMIANRAAERERRIAFVQAGGTAEELADQLGMDAKDVRYWLREHGVDVPDARTTKQTPMTTFTCPQCGTAKSIPSSTYRSNRKQGWGGPYCSLKCSARARVEREARDRVTGHR